MTADRQLTRETLDELEGTVTAGKAVVVPARIFAYLAHDLRSPLGLVDGAAHELVGDEEGGRFESLFWRGIRRIGHFADRLSMLAELEEGTLYIRAVPVDVSSLVAAALERAEALESRRDIELVFSPADCPRALVDPDRTVHALVELLLCAQRHARSRIHIALAVLDDATLELSITDDGRAPAQPGLLFHREADRMAVGRDPLVLASVRELLGLQGGSLRWDGGFKIELPSEATEREFSPIEPIVTS